MQVPSRPVDILRSALGEQLGAGQVAVVLAPPGVGKTAVLVHVAWAALEESQSVLHVAVGQTVDHVRAHYDQLGIDDGVGPSARRQALERRRMIHCTRAEDFQVAKLRAHLDILSSSGAFVPALVVVDGLDEETVVHAAAELAAMARDLGVPLWVTMRLLTDRIPPEIREAGTVGLRLTPRNGAVHLSVLRNGGEAPLDLALSPDSLLVASSRVGPSARPDPTRVTLYSTGAAGSEDVFGQLAAQYGLQERTFTFEGHKATRTVGATLLSPRELESGNVSMADVSRRLSRTYSTEGTLLRKILQALWHVVSRAQKVFVIGTIQPDGTVVGGTGWSVELARMWNKELWVYDLGSHAWHQWSGSAWIAGTPVIDALHVAGSGTRKLDDAGRRAIEDLFARSFG